MKEDKKLSQVMGKVFPKKESGNSAKDGALSKRVIINILVEGIANLERGLRVLDHNLIITKEPLDILAVDLLGELVIIELELEENETVILRALEHFDWIINNVNSIIHKYNKEKIDITLTPRIILISRGFSDDFLRKLTYVNTTKIALYEYELKDEEGITKLRFRPHVFALAQNKTIDINMPRFEDLINLIRIVALRQFCHRIIKETRGLNKDVNMDTSSGYIDIKKNESSLMRIYPHPDFFWLSLNPRGKWQGIKVEDERKFEEISKLVRSKINPSYP